MPEENVPVIGSLTTNKESLKKFHKTLSILIVISLIVVLTGAFLLYKTLTIKKNNQTGDSKSNSKVATKSNSIKSEGKQGLIFVFLKSTGKVVDPGGGYSKISENEIWLYDNGGSNKLVDKGYYLDYELSRNNKELYYISGEIINKYLVGTSINQLTLSTKKSKTLVNGSKVDQIETWKSGYKNIALSPMQTKLAFVEDGVSVIDLSNSKSEQLLTSTYYSEETGQGHTYNTVNWSPTGKYLWLKWSGYEVSGDELLNLEDNKITELYQGYPPGFDLITFINDDQLVFSRGEEYIVEKAKDNLNNETSIFVGKEIGNLEIGSYSPYTYPNFAIFSAKLNSLFFGKTTFSAREGSNAIWRMGVVLYERQNKKLKSLGQLFDKDLKLGNLQLTSDNKNLVFDVTNEASQKTDIWTIEIKTSKMSKIIENASKADTGY